MSARRDPGSTAVPVPDNDAVLAAREALRTLPADPAPGAPAAPTGTLLRPPAGRRAVGVSEQPLTRQAEAEHMRELDALAAAESAATRGLPRRVVDEWPTADDDLATLAEADGCDVYPADG